MKNSATCARKIRMSRTTKKIIGRRLEMTNEDGVAEMTNDPAKRERMTKQTRMPNNEKKITNAFSFGFHASSFLRHSSFVLRHFLPVTTKTSSRCERSTAGVTRAWLSSSRTRKLWIVPTSNPEGKTPPTPDV